MRIVKLAATVAAFGMLASLAQAGEIKGTHTFYWTYKPIAFGQGKPQGFDMGWAIGPETGADGGVTATECMNIDSPEAARGTCLAHVTADDSYWIEYVCDQPVNPLPAGAIFACKGTAEAKGGTGKFASIKGGNTNVLTVTGVLADGTLVGYTTSEPNFTY